MNFQVFSIILKDRERFDFLPIKTFPLGMCKATKPWRKGAGRLSPALLASTWKTKAPRVDVAESFLKPGVFLLKERYQQIRHTSEIDRNWYYSLIIDNNWLSQKLCFKAKKNMLRTTPRVVALPRDSSGQQLLPAAAVDATAARARSKLAAPGDPRQRYLAEAEVGMNIWMFP